MSTLLPIVQPTRAVSPPICWGTLVSTTNCCVEWSAHFSQQRLNTEQQIHSKKHGNSGMPFLPVTSGVVQRRFSANHDAWHHVLIETPHLVAVTRILECKVGGGCQVTATTSHEQLLATINCQGRAREPCPAIHSRDFPCNEFWQCEPTDCFLC